VLRRVCCVMAVGVWMAGCGGGSTSETTSGSAPVITADGSSTTSSPPPTGTPLTTSTIGTVAGGLPMCQEVGYPTAPEDWYADSPIYVGNEMPIEEIQAFASGLEGYENYWIDRDHNGWVTVGFVDSDVEAHQAVLESEFPDVGVVAVEMSRTAEELDRIRQRIDEALPADMNAWNMYEARGVVTVWVGRLTPDRIALVNEIVGDDPACLEGQDPATTPEPGPQPEGGEGWVYLATVDNMVSERPTVIADLGALNQIWETLGVEGEPVEVDFQTHIVVAFPVFYSGSCPETRIDDVDVEGDLVHPIIPLITTEQMCTDDANPRTYLVSMERDVLPPPPFRISYEKGTLIEVQVRADLRQPGSMPAEGEVEDVVGLPTQTPTPTPEIIEPGFPRRFTIDVSCGIDYLGIINWVGWHIAEDSSGLPTEWQEQTVDGLLDLELRMTEGPNPTLTATAGGHEVRYVPGADNGAPCD